MLSGFDDALAARLQRISPVIRATSASTISVTFRQKRPLFDIYFGSALVPLPTFVVCACFNADISASVAMRISSHPSGAISAHYTTLTRKIKCKALGSLPDLKFKSGAAA
jgi:hypothetical protein